MVYDSSHVPVFFLMKLNKMQDLSPKPPFYYTYVYYIAGEDTKRVSNRRELALVLRARNTYLWTHETGNIETEDL